MVNAKKSLGQNFLIDSGIIKKIIDAGEIKPDDHIVEIGPGKGALTRALLGKAEKVSAVELDSRLIPFLKMEFGHRAGFELFHEDALKFTPPSGKYKLIANIPYYISSPLLNHFLYEQFINGNPPELIVLMLQKEFAEKIIAKDEKQSILSLEVKLFGDAEIVCNVDKTAFVPMPKIDSAVIKIKVYEKPEIDCDLAVLFKLMKHGFSEKRKKLINNLAKNQYGSADKLRILFESLNIEKDIRAERMSFKDWEMLAKALAL